MSRWFLFLIVVALGLAGGLYYGWVIDPVENTNTTPAMLGEDYKADYVLMTAEAYRLEGDLALAAERLSALGDEPPAQFVSQAIRFAVTIRPPYAESDLALMRTLLEDLNAQPPPPATQEAAP